MPRWSGVLWTRRAGPSRVVLLALAALLVVTGCGGGGSRRVAPSVSPTTSASPTGKPGGTLRVAGTVRSAQLDPARASTDADLLVARLVLRELYSYKPGNPDPQPDLAAGQPTLSSDRLTATIQLRDNALWNVPSGRQVNSGDVLRGLKRLCLSDVLSPVRGYFSQMVVGYGEFCSKASRLRTTSGSTTGASSSPNVLSGLDSLQIPGLTAVGDRQIMLKLRKPAIDLTQVLALPATAPLPIESAGGDFTPDSFVADGPYRFVSAEAGETYRLARNPQWDPASDPLRAAFVDHVSFTGGLSPADIEARLHDGRADLAWDVEAPGTVPAPASASPSPRPSPGPSPAASPSAGQRHLIRSENRSLVFLGVGTSGPAALALSTAPARSAIAACLNRSQLVTAFGGSGRAAATARLLTDQIAPASRPSSPSPSGSSSPSGRSRPQSCAASVAAARLTGSSLSLLTPDNSGSRAAASLIALQLAAGGVTVRVDARPSAAFVAAARQGPWDLILFTDQPDFAGSRSLLTPVVDARWPGANAIGPLRRSSTWITDLQSALAESTKDAAARRQLALESTILSDGAVTPLVRLATVRTVGPNVGSAPVLDQIGNADPTNVALEATRPDESPTPTTGTP